MRGSVCDGVGAHAREEHNATVRVAAEVLAGEREARELLLGVRVDEAEVRLVHRARADVGGRRCKGQGRAGRAKRA